MSQLYAVIPLGQEIVVAARAAATAAGDSPAAWDLLELAADLERALWNLQFSVVAEVHR